MPRFTAAYSGFVAGLVEVETLRRTAAALERKDPMGQRDEINALCRGAIVLLCSNLEAFIRELGEVALDSLTTRAVPRTGIAARLYYHISQDLLDEFRNTADPEKAGEKVFAFLHSDLPYWSKAGPFPVPIPPERFNKGFSNPSFKKIKKYFNRFGYGNYASDLATRLQAKYQPSVNMVNHLVGIRNNVAHGDRSATKTPGEILTMTSVLRVFCGNTDAVFANWWKDSFCPIR